MSTLTIDGSQGEGGGQIVRTSLALSALTGQNLVLKHIRAGRKKPGLLRQHLTALRAITAISNGQVEGDALGSTQIRFQPGVVTSDAYRFAVGSAGSANLVLQTVLPPLMCANGPSTVVIEGGTHNDKSPPFHFLRDTFLPQLSRFGPEVQLELERWGFYPAGGGRMVATIRPGAKARPVTLLKRAAVTLSATAVVCNLARSIAERELATLRRRLGIPKENLHILELKGPGPGNVVWVSAEAGSTTELFTGFGRKGATAENVAGRLAKEVSTWLNADVPVGEHLADQLLIPMAMAGQGTFRTVAPSLHTLTNMAVIETFLPVTFSSEQDGPGWLISVSRRD